MNRTKTIFQAYPQAPWRSQVNILAVILLLVTAIAVVGMFLLNVTSRASTIGREIQEVQVTISALEIENAAKQSDLAYLTSYEVMLKRAERLGYELSSIETIDYIVDENYTGRESPKLAEGSRPMFTTIMNEIPEEYTESIFTWLGRKIFERPLPLPELNP